MTTYIVYLSLGEGSYAQSLITSDLAAAIAACPSGGRVEQQTATGAQVVYTAA